MQVPDKVDKECILQARTFCSYDFSPSHRYNQSMTIGVVIADDGSIDGAKKHIDEMATTSEWQNRLKWVGCGMNVFMRAGRTRKGAN